jgi:hypothetical protein
VEKIAENKFTITKPLFMEGMLRISRDGYGKSARKAMLMVLGLWTAFFLYTLAVQGDLTACLGILALLCAAGLWLCAGMPRSNAKRLWKALEGKCGCNLQRTTSFYPDHFEILGDGVERHITYEEVIQVKQSRRLLILVCEDKTGVLLALDGFRQGNANDVKALCSGTDRLGV